MKFIIKEQITKKKVINEIHYLLVSYKQIFLRFKHRGKAYGVIEVFVNGASPCIYVLSK